MITPDKYEQKLNIIDTQRAIKIIRKYFQDTLCASLNIMRVSAPLFVRMDTGLNDNLSGTENAVGFNIRAVDDCYCEVVHSLAKWKRMALGKYGFTKGSGMYTDMNAIRKDEEVLDNLHSVYVDQWDWELVIGKEERNMNTLRDVVTKIYKSILAAEKMVVTTFNGINAFLPNDIHFVSSFELEKQYPTLSPREREDAVCKQYGAVFLTNIGCPLSNGLPHDLRAPDYDDWSLNGDILVWYPVLNRAVELSSMGIRVDEDSLRSQLAYKGITEYTDYHKAILDQKYPYTIGGGIGQSRLCMVLLEKAHIGEVQSSVWTKEDYAEAAAHGIFLL